MVERARRLRMGFAHSSPGASGVTARPNYVGPSGNGLVERMNAGGNSLRDQGDLNGSLPFSEGGPEDEGKRRSGAPRGERPASLGVRRKVQLISVAPFGAPLPSPFGEGAFPLAARGWEIPAHPAPCENRGGGALDLYTRRLFEM
jgi:hypothetical protein